MSEDKNYYCLAYYYFCPIEDPKQFIQEHKEFCKNLDFKGRIYISEQGINGQASASKADTQKYIEWLKQYPALEKMQIKLHPYHEHAFEKLKIKYRQQLAALDAEYDYANTGVHVSPDQWKEMLEKEDGHILIDVRNDYEWEVGKFDGAETPACSTFREFQQYTKELQDRVDPKNTPVMMYCTGGIRCEIYSAYLKEHGFDKVYQLDGGVINYGLKEGSEHWLGKLFVFDDRMTVPISDEEAPVIGKCHECNTPTDNYYNCANMDCNKLFLACSCCLEKHQGCCSDECVNGPRVRPYQHQNPHKPFRKRYRYNIEKKSG